MLSVNLQNFDRVTQNIMMQMNVIFTLSFSNFSVMQTCSYSINMHILLNNIVCEKRYLYSLDIRYGHFSIEMFAVKSMI